MRNSFWLTAPCSFRITYANLPIFTKIHSIKITIFSATAKISSREISFFSMAHPRNPRKCIPAKMYSRENDWPRKFMAAKIYGFKVIKRFDCMLSIFLSLINPKSRRQCEVHNVDNELILNHSSTTQCFYNNPFSKDHQVSLKKLQK